MSYRTFKRVLGETNLERKCRWWFGISLFILLTLSFTWYGRRTDELVNERIHTLSRELFRAGWQKLHIEKLADIGSPASRRPKAMNVQRGAISIATWPTSSDSLGTHYQVGRDPADSG